MVLTPRTKHLQNPHQELNQEEQKEQTKSIPSTPPEDRIFISQSLCVHSPSSWGKKKRDKSLPIHAETLLN